MASIMTNAAALTALQSLNATNKNLETTQARISTGFRVAEASDNAAYWSIATTMRSDNKALGTVQDALGLGASKIDTAYTGLNKAIETTNEIKVKLVAAVGSTDQDKAKIQTEIKALQSQLKSYADAATFSGTNMLSVTSVQVAAANDGVQADVKIVSAFNRTSAGVASISTIDIDVEGIKLFDNGLAADVKNGGILDRETVVWDTGTAQTAFDNAFAAAVAGGATDIDANTAAILVAAAADPTANGQLDVSVYNLDITTLGIDDDFISGMIGKVEASLKDMTTAATNLGAAKQRVDLQKTFTQGLMDSIDRGVGQLVDADMNKESTRLQALQVQQQLGIQALSIANGNAQGILSLFR